MILFVFNQQPSAADDRKRSSLKKLGCRNLIALGLTLKIKELKDVGVGVIDDLVTAGPHIGDRLEKRIFSNRDIYNCVVGVGAELTTSAYEKFLSVTSSWPSSRTSDTGTQGRLQTTALCNETPPAAHSGLTSEAAQQPINQATTALLDASTPHPCDYHKILHLFANTTSGNQSLEPVDEWCLDFSFMEFLPGEVSFTFYQQGSHQGGSAPHPHY
ncbi:hypothetical protein GGTG_13537 [Gaeumannomyces tritici R3-111a-1]|uniref:Uncharacterized protein n=1 Tax=Gaeumannomyces tritici (strain R3-111a-1) TaxID=644352 RepID=J3PJ55_GAET3|nr:hypothetical protein GGTG_13537 [Gaeumannomyces tritici R3-111a-1]EJT68873.1 hypothetical protein GGTG_13537 [Gaeumannomyces tritici R3-111a-1]